MKTYKEFINELSIGDWILDTAVKVPAGVIVGGAVYLAYKGWSKAKQMKFNKKAAPVVKKANRDIKRLGDTPNKNKLKRIEHKRDKSLEDISNTIE